MNRPLLVWPLSLLLAILALGGLYGGISLLIDPSGEQLGITDALHQLPVRDFLLPGIFLLFVMGVAPLILAAGLIALPAWKWAQYLCQWSRYHWAWTGTICLMAVLALWLVVEAMMIGFFAITYITAALGVVITGLCSFPSVRRYYRFDIK